MKTKHSVLLMARELEAGGSERQLIETALGLDQSRFEPYVASFRANASRTEVLRAAKVTVVHFPVDSYRSPQALVGACRMAHFVRNKNIQLVHTFDAPTTIFAVPVVRYLTPAIMLSSQRGHRDLTPEFRRFLRWTDSHVDGIVVNCNYLKRHLTVDENVPDRLIRVCYNAIDLDQFRPDAGSPRPASLPADAFVIGVVCMLRAEKGLTTMIDAFAKVRRLRTLMKLAIVGSGLQLESLQAHARERGVYEDVVWQPATQNVAPWLRSFDIFVLPSLNEALSNSIMEAMACGCPVIASNVGGNPELIEPGTRGLLFESQNADALAATLAALANDEPLRLRLAEAGQRFIHEGFSRQSSAARMGDIYESFLASRR